MKDSPAGTRGSGRPSSGGALGRLQKKTEHLDDDYTIIAIDQTPQEITTDLVHALFPKGKRPTPIVLGAWESLKLLSGDTFFLKCEDNFTAEITTRLLDALQTKFGEKICVVLDNAPYFAVNDVHDYVADTPIEMCHLPRGSPELNPAQMCWQKLNKRLGNQLFEEPTVRSAGGKTSIRCVSSVSPGISGRDIAVATDTTEQNIIVLTLRQPLSVTAAASSDCKNAPLTAGDYK